MLQIKESNLPKLAHGQKPDYIYSDSGNLMHLIVVEEHVIFDYVWEGTDKETFIAVKTYPRTVVE